MSRLAPVILLSLLWSACGGTDGPSGEPGEAAEPAAAPGSSASVRITQPEDGSTVPQGPLEVVFEVEGVEIAPAGTMDEGTGHHHLIVDAEVVSWTEPIGVEEGRYIHMGQAQTSFTVEGLAPGEHRLIAVVADGVHIPLDPPVADTVHIIVEGGDEPGQ